MKKNIPNWKDDLHIRSTINVDNATKSEKNKKGPIKTDQTDWTKQKKEEMFIHEEVKTGKQKWWKEKKMIWF
jgi:hypothetical protein